jgi:hypothetical protein
MLVTVVACSTTIGPLPGDLSPPDAGRGNTRGENAGGDTNDAGASNEATGGTAGHLGGTSSHGGGTSGRSTSGTGGTSSHAGGTSSHTGGNAGTPSHAGGTSSHTSGGVPNGEGGEAGATSGSGDDAGAGGNGANEGGNAGANDERDDAPGVTPVPGVSERKRVHPTRDIDFVLEEELLGFTSPGTPHTRLRRLTHDLGSRAEWDAPDDFYISDFCVHPSGAVSAVLVGYDHTIWLVRLDAKLESLGMSVLHDPDAANDPHASDLGVTDLAANPFAWDAARIGANGEAVFTTVVSSDNALIGYRLSFASGNWSVPSRTLIEPPTGLTPFLPISGSFDTFGAIVEWFRAPLDLDPDGNAYVAIWAGQGRVRLHASTFGDGVQALPLDPDNPSPSDSDILLTKLDANGNRSWTRVIGSEHEDEPYALRATSDAVAVVGRSRRFSGFDNTVWDALVSVTTAAGDQTRSTTLELDASSILLGVDARPGGGWLVAGSDGWTQNPEGLSVLSNGNPLLLELSSLDSPPVRRTVTPGPRHNELHTVIGETGGIAFAGHDDGPLTHSGDGDASQIHATGVLGFLPD